MLIKNVCLSLVERPLCGACAHMIVTSTPWHEQVMDTMWPFLWGTCAMEFKRAFSTTMPAPACSKSAARRWLLPELLWCAHLRALFFCSAFLVSNLGIDMCWTKQYHPLAPSPPLDLKWFMFGLLDFRNYNSGSNFKPHDAWTSNSILYLQQFWMPPEQNISPVWLCDTKLKGSDSEVKVWSLHNTTHQLLDVCRLIKPLGAEALEESDRFRIKILQRFQISVVLVFGVKSRLRHMNY